MKKEAKTKNIYSIIAMIATMFFLRFDIDFYLIAIMLSFITIYFIVMVIKILNREKGNRRKFGILTNGSISMFMLCGAIAYVLIEFNNNILAISVIAIGFIQLFIVLGVAQKYREDKSTEDSNLGNKLS